VTTNATPPGGGWVAEGRAGVRLLAALPRFLRRPVDPGTAAARLRQRLERREASLLELAQRTIFANPRSPYRPLLRHAGCEAGDLTRLVNREGVEGALSTLHRQGVYLTVEEFKGRRPVVRGAATWQIDPVGFVNPSLPGHLPGNSSGSRGAPMPVPMNLATVRDDAVDRLLIFQDLGGLDWRQAHWGIPGGFALAYLLECAAFGARSTAWFSQVDPATPGLHPRYRWSARAMWLGGRLAGVPQPVPRYAPTDDPSSLLEWIRETRRAGETPHVFTYASSAVRLCQRAASAGVDLGGLKLTLGGEPITAARLALAEGSGAAVYKSFGTRECNAIGQGCLEPAAIDDFHLLRDRVAIVQPGPHHATAELPPSALLLTSLLPTAPLMLLNVCLGDQAQLVDRSCGCPLERRGWTGHVHTVRSYQKLTAAGMNFLDADLIRVLEQTLPARFGGGPADYQLVEEERADGRSSLRLVIDPSVGPLEPAEVADAFLTALGGRSPAERLMALHWRGEALVEVERRRPLVTSVGKIQHLHQSRAGGASARSHA
jgi:hypothetical protein